MLNKRKLGNTGLMLTELGFGAWALGGEGKVMNYGDVSESEAISVLEAYVEAGGNFIDTARAYNKSEAIIGKFLNQNRDKSDLYIATKTAAGQTIDTISGIREDLETSLRLLGIEYVDILFLHQPPNEVDVMNKALDLLMELKDEGKIKVTGASIKGVDVTEDTKNMCRQYIATGKCNVIQLVYSIVRQGHYDVITEAKNEGVGIIGRTSLESGLLTGKYKPGHQFEGQDQRSRYKQENVEYVLNTVEELKKFAIVPPFTSLSEVAIEFALKPKGITSVIIGARNVEQIKRNMSVANLPELSDEVVNEIKKRYGHLTSMANYLS